MIVCSCANPDCMVNGCAQARQLRATFTRPIEWPKPTAPTYQFTPLPVPTEERIREIIREELALALKALERPA